MSPHRWHPLVPAREGKEGDPECCWADWAGTLLGKAGKKIPIALRDGNGQPSGAPSPLRGFILPSNSERLIKLNLESRKINIPTSSLVTNDHCNSRFSHFP